MALGLLLAAMLAAPSPHSPWCHKISEGRYRWLGPPSGAAFDWNGSLGDRTVPAFKHGARSGVKLLGSSLDGCGVQPGDVLTAINGESPQLIGWLPEVRDQVVKERHATLALLRRGQRLRVEIEAAPLCTRVSETNYTVDVDALTAFHEATMTNVDRLDLPARVFPVARNGVTIGLQIHVTGRSIYRECGIAQDDIVLDVNGMPATTPEAVLEAYAVARKARRAELVLLRRRKRLTLVIEPG